MKITKKDFLKYLAIQRSGKINMFDVLGVSKLTGLNKKQLIDIMENYGKYTERYGINE